MPEGQFRPPLRPQDCDGPPQPGSAHQVAWPAQPAPKSPPPAPAVPTPPAPPSPLPATTPDGSPIFRLATWGQRARAYVIDFAVVLVPLIAVWALLVPRLIDRAAADQQLQADFDVIADSSTEAFPIARLIGWTLLIVLCVVIVYWLVIGVYAAMFMRGDGRTPGQRAIGIRVMRADGEPVTFWWALYRTLVVREVLFGFAALATLGVSQAAQYLWPLADHERRTLHDMVARSRVVVDSGEQR